MMVTNKMKKWKKGLVILLAATLVLQGNMADAGRSVTTFAETEETYQVQTKSVDGTEVVVEHLTEVIKVRDFSVSNVGGDSAIINVNDTFAIDLQMPTDTKVYTQGYIRFFLVPYGSENAAKDFADGLRYGIDYEQCTRTYGLSLESATTSSASFSSVLLNSYGIYEPPLPVIPSGAYYPAVVVYEEDVMSEAAHSKASLVLGTKPVRVSNPEDGGYLGDEFYGVEEEKQEYVELNVTVYLEEEIYDKCRVVAYSEDLVTCYGNVPCKVIPGETVAISIVPEHPDMGYTYNFGNIKNGSPYYVQVPEDGYVDVTVYPFTRCAEAYGRVCDENNQPLSDVTVSLEMKTTGTLSESVTTDKDGNYRFTGVYNGGDAVLRFSKDGYYLEDYVIPQSQLSEGNSISCNMTLKESEPAFSLTLPEDIDPSFGNALWKEVRKYLRVYDHSGNSEIPGTFVTGEDGISFLPEWESDLGDSYVVKLKYPRLEMVPVTVNQNQSAELRVNFGAVAFQTISGDNHYGYAVTEMIDDTGRCIYYTTNLLKVTDEVLLPEGNYQLLFYATASQMSLSDEQYASIMDAEHMLSFSVESGKVTELGEIEAPFVNTTGENPFAEKSFLTVPSEIKPSEDLLTISGHIEADSSDYQITSFRIYAMKNVSDNITEQSVTAMYENGTLAVNGELIPTSLYRDTYILTHQLERIDLAVPVSGVCDFSAKLRINEQTSMIVTVLVDAVVNGMPVENLSLGEYYVSGDKVTLNAFDTTATGEVYCHGFAIPNSTVYLYDGSNLLSSVDVNRWGKWETVVWFPRENDAFTVVRTYSSTHVLKAVCDGEESAPLTVYFNSDCAALSGIYLVDAGKRLTDSYVWERNTQMSCEADVQNADRITETPVFHVLCSDGTMLEFPAKKGETKSRLGIPITTYYSETFDYGEKNLLPVKVWFDFKQESVKQQLPEPLPGEFTMDLCPNASSKMNVTYKEIPKLPSVSEFGDDVVVTLTTYETTEAELDAMKNAGADFYQVHDGTQIVYGEYIQTLETGVKYGIVDFTKNTYKVVEMHIYDKDNCPKSTTASLEENESELILMSSPNGQTGQQEGGGLTNATLWTVVVEDFKKEVSGFGDEGVEYLAGYMKNSSNSMISKASPYINKVGVGQVMNGFDLGGSANAAYAREQTASGNKDIISFLIRSSYDLPREQGQKIENMAHQARDDYNRATESTNKNLGTEIMSGIANEVLSKHPLGKEVVDATEFTGIQGAIKSASSAYADADWAYAGQSYTELMFEYMKATNLSRDEIADLYSQYQEGKMSMKQVSEYIRNSLNKKNDGNSKNYTGIVDPSGYIYEAVASNRVEGATVTLYGEGMEWFEAEAFGQSNPLISDSDGRYAWDVPEGNWFVKVYKAGYEENTSQNDPAATVTIDGINYLPVLPPQLDVNIGLTSVEKPHASMQFADGSWYLIFDRYVEVNTVNAENINIECAKRNGKADASYSFEAVDAELSPEHTPICGGKLLAKSFKIILNGMELTEEDAMTITLHAAVTGYNGKSANGLIKVNGGFTAGQEESQPSEPETPGRTEDKNKDDEKVSVPPSDEMPVGIILAIAAGIVVVLAGSVAGVLILRRRKKKNK